MAGCALACARCHRGAATVHPGASCTYTLRCELKLSCSCSGFDDDHFDSDCTFVLSPELVALHLISGTFALVLFLLVLLVVAVGVRSGEI